MAIRFAVVCTTFIVLAAPARAQFGNFINDAQRKAVDVAGQAASQAIQQQPAAPAPAATAAQGTQAAAAPAGGAGQAAPAAGEVYGNRFDFVPGDKVLVYDDFSDTDVGEYPAKWTIKGGGGNAIEVVQVGSRRFLKSRYAERDQDSARTFLRYEIKGDMPKNFTIEFDMDVEGAYGVVFSALRGFGGQEIQFRTKEDFVRSVNANGKMLVKKGIQHVAIAVSGTQAKVYVAGERVLSDPDAVVRPITRLGMHFMVPNKEEGDHQMITSVRIAEGGKPAKQMLAGEGRIVTHGILFDTGSDVIKPESGPTLRAILALLQEDPALKFVVEGHTDDQGGPKVNGPLSERRAASVVAWLVKQGVAAERLQAKGMGQLKPIDSNDSAEGRANNRRVEFAKV